MQTRAKLKKAAAAWDACEQVLLGCLVVGMVALSATQIVLRNVFKSGITWAEPVLGASLLWITMLGALAATGARKHINIDIASRIFRGRMRALVVTVTNLFAAAVSGLLAWAALHYVLAQKEAAGVLFLGVPAWSAYTIMPLCFGVMAIRFLIQTAVALADAFGPREPLPARGGGEGGA
ncbi:MAG: TRAP transporter small permease [Kiritimatiellae bacterium]|nr:TRAP transporter small permease [Kiritimatiellia bacterium]